MSALAILLGARSLQIASDRSRSLQVAPERSRSHQIAPDRPRSLQIAPDRSRSLQIASDRPRSPQIAPDRSRSPQIVPDRPTSPQIAPDRPRSPQIVPDRPRSLQGCTCAALGCPGLLWARHGAVMRLSIRNEMGSWVGGVMCRDSKGHSARQEIYMHYVFLLTLCFTHQLDTK